MRFLIAVLFFGFFFGVLDVMFADIDRSSDGGCRQLRDTDTLSNKEFACVFEDCKCGEWYEYTLTHQLITSQSKETVER